MRKLFVAVATLALLVCAAIAIVFTTAVGQDTVFRHAVQSAMGQATPAFDGLRIVVCGSASPLGNNPERAQACIAVMTPEHLMLFDVGARSPMQIARARIPMRRLTAVFLTHFHSDHIAALPDVNLASWVQGRKTSLPVYGPEGVDEVVGGFNQAYRLDRQYRTAHHGAELLPPAAGPMTPATFTPGEIVWQDKLLTVTAFTVDHTPVAPAVGYRVDYRGRSVVISGDTVATDSLFEAARGADLLLHDALSRALLDPMIAAAEAANVPVMPKIMRDVIDYHADAHSLEARAAQAGIRQLAFYHLVPLPPNVVAEKIFSRGLSPTTLLVRDLDTFDLPPNSTEIRISAL